MSLDTIFKLSVIVNMIDNLTGPMARINSSVENSVGKIQKLQQGFGDMTKSGLAMSGIGYQLAASALAPVEATFETKKALGELSSVGVKDLEALEAAAKKFSDTWSGTTKSQFVGAAYDIKSGISSLTDEGVAEYTALSGLTAKATKSTIEEMTNLFATGYGIYKDFYKDLSDIEFGEMFSAGIAKSVQAFKTTGSGMAQAISTLGGAATSANVPLEEQLSILGMLQATMSGSEAGTKYKAFLRSAAKAGDELGISFMDANKQLLSMPEILSLLRSKFGDTMDAAEKMSLQKAFGTDEAVAIIDLLYQKTGGLESNILMLYDSMGQGAKIAEDMANAINKTEPEKYQILQQKLHNVKEEIGNQLLPTYNRLLDMGGSLLERFSGWIANNQGLVKVLSLLLLTLGIVLGTMGVFVTIVGTTGLLFTKTATYIGIFVKALRGIPSMLETLQIRAMYAGDAIRNGFTSIRTFAATAVTGIKNVTTSILTMAKTAVVNGATAIKNFVLNMAGMAKQAIITAVRAMPSLIASVWSFTAALLANPITWIIVGIVALIAAIILLWRNWDSVVAWIQDAWSKFVDGIKAGFDWIKNLFSGLPVSVQLAIAAFMPFIGIPLLIITHWDSIVSFFSNLWVRVKEGFVNGIQGIKNFVTGTFSWFKESGAKIMSTFTDGIKSVLLAPYNAVKNGLSKVRKLLPFSDAKEGPLSELTLSGRRVFETIGSGMIQAQDVPAEVTEKAFSNMDMTAEEPERKISLVEVIKEIIKDRKDKDDKDGETDSNGVNIDKLYIQTDISKLKDLPTLFKLLKEIEDYNNGNGKKPTPIPAG